MAGDGGSQARDGILQDARLTREDPVRPRDPGIAAAPGFSSFAGFLKTLRDGGYECDRGVVNASSFGVPQHRRRYVLLAACSGQPKLPASTEESGGAGTVRTAIDRDTLGFSDVYGRMWWDRVAPTLTSRCNSLSNGRFGHPEQDRAIILREAAALQTFPDDYEFLGTRHHVARWIGNAVPVSLAEAVGRAAMAAVS